MHIHENWPANLANAAHAVDLRHPWVESPDMRSPDATDMNTHSDSNSAAPAPSLSRSEATRARTGPRGAHEHGTSLGDVGMARTYGREESRARPSAWHGRQQQQQPGTAGVKQVMNAGAVPQLAIEDVDGYTNGNGHGTAWGVSEDVF